MLLDHANNIPRLGFPHEDLHWELTSSARQLEKKVATRICKGCFAYLPAYKRLCPYCGFEAPPPDEEGFIPDETTARLQGLDTSPEAMRRMFFDTMVRVARKRGYKPGFAGARFKERYGGWPPWDWSEAVKSSFASDPEWQANLEANTSRKKQRDLEKLAKELAKIEEPEDD